LLPPLEGRVLRIGVPIGAGPDRLDGLQPILPPPLEEDEEPSDICDGWGILKRKID